MLRDNSWTFRRSILSAWWRLGQAWFLRIFEPSVSGIVNCRYERCFKDIASTLFLSKGFPKKWFFAIVLTEITRHLSVVSWRKFHTLKTSGVQTFGYCGFWSFESWNYNSLSCVQHNGGEIVSYSISINFTNPSRKTISSQTYPKITQKFTRHPTT